MVEPARQGQAGSLAGKNNTSGNMNLNYSPVADARGRLLKWLNQFRKRSGVYVIRKPGLLFQTVLYVGESHTNNLKKTILRHFQKWTGKTAGPTYARTKVELAVISCKSEEAVELQNKVIGQLNPQDNIKGESENPF